MSTLAFTSLRRTSVLVLMTASGLVAACSAIFGDTAQCSSDSDCSGFGASAVCGASGTCVRGTDTDAAAQPQPDGAAAADGSSPPPAPPPVPPSPPIDPLCVATTKPVVTLGNKDGTDYDVAANMSLSCKNDYLVYGHVYVTQNATLTVERNTTLRFATADNGKKGALIVSRDGKLQSNGDPMYPVVMTSNEATRAADDWEGVFMLGLASPPSQIQNESPADLAYGDANPTLNHSSGTLRYTRVEYGHVGVMLAGVGSGTAIEGLMVRRTGDHSCLQAFNGRVNLKKVVCQSAGGPQFAFTNGYDGKAQFLVGQRSRQAGIFVDGESKLVLYNASIFGSTNHGAPFGLVVRNSTFDVRNMILQGFGAGWDLLGTLRQNSALKGNVFFDNAPQNIAYTELPADAGPDADGGPTDPNDPLFDDDNGFSERGFFLQNMNVGNMNPGLTPYDQANPNFRPAAAITTNAQTPPADGFFDTNAKYIGALMDANDPWLTSAWVRFAAD